MGGKRRGKHCPAAQCRPQEKNYCKRHYKLEGKPQEKKAPHWRKRQDTKCKRKAPHCVAASGSAGRKIKTAQQKSFILHDCKRQYKPQDKKRKRKGTDGKRQKKT